MWTNTSGFSVSWSRWSSTRGRCASRRSAGCDGAVPPAPVAGRAAPATRARGADSRLVRLGRRAAGRHEPRFVGTGPGGVARDPQGDVGRHRPGRDGGATGGGAGRVHGGRGRAAGDVPAAESGAAAASGTGAGDPDGGVLGAPSPARRPGRRAAGTGGRRA